MTLENDIDVEAARTDFSGIVLIDIPGDTDFVKAYGLADRRHGLPNTVETRFATASGTKGLTALTVVSLVEQGVLELSTTARSVLGADLPLVADDVTVEHLLSHRSGIGDYLDEEQVEDTTDYVMPVPVHELATTEQYLAVLDGHDTVAPTGQVFAYCNGSFVILALIAERVGGEPFHDLVRRLVCEPAGMTDTSFLRSDELPSEAAIGYLTTSGPRTNVLHLPVRGNGDGGVYTTAADMSSFWTALFAGRIVSERWVHEMVRPRSEGLDHGEGYGLGFWLDLPVGRVELRGHDAGVSFRSSYGLRDASIWTAISNTTEGAWPIGSVIDEALAG